MSKQVNPITQMIVGISLPTVGGITGAMAVSDGVVWPVLLFFGALFVLSVVAQANDSENKKSDQEDVSPQNPALEHENVLYPDFEGSTGTEVVLRPEEYQSTTRKIRGRQARKVS